MNSFGWIFTNFTAEWMNEFSQATLLYHVFQKRDSYVNLCKSGTTERDAFFRFIPKQIFLQLAFANFIITFFVRLVGWY